MSYILEALRKADAERERDPARGIHAQPLAAQPARGAAGLSAWVWPAAAGAVVLLAAGAALWPREATVAAAVPPAAPAAAAVPAARASATVAVADSVSPPAPPPVAVAAPRAPVRASSAAPGVPAAPAVAAPPPAAPAAPAQPAAAPAGDRVFAVNELPPEVQRDLPRLAISGGVHSENAAQRVLIVGGQVLGEGAELAPGVVLEQIRAHTAVLRFRGYRYAVGY